MSKIYVNKMDLLKEIEAQIANIKTEDESNYLDSIYTHIERAEYYYFQGKADVNYFNDVIYRSNQAYEGALKESYKVLAEKNIDEVINKSPNEIEKYFESNKVFRDRVLQLFTIYRQEWRNKSAHDYKLFFDESEAFIALTSVSSFVHLLLKQIQEKIAYLKEQKKLEDEIVVLTDLKNSISEKSSTREILIDILISFSRINSQIFHKSSGEKREVEILGLIHAYLDYIDIFTEVKREPSITNGPRIYRPDFIIQNGEEKIILEVMRITAIGSIIRSAENQLLLLMQATKIKNAILFIAMFNEEKQSIDCRTIEHIFNEELYTISILTIK